MLVNVYANKSESWMIAFSMYKQTGYKDQLFIAILYLVFVKCDLLNKSRFNILRKCQGKFDCLVFEMLYIKETQT